VEVPAWIINGVGVGAGLCSIASFVPQIAKIWRERDASGVSLRMFAVTVTAFILWTTYGILQGSWPIAVSNALCLALAGVIVALRLRFGDGTN
jgi:MtN3 and saliva related transmembrane protein